MTSSGHKPLTPLQYSTHSDGTGATVPEPLFENHPANNTHEGLKLDKTAMSRSKVDPPETELSSVIKLYKDGKFMDAVTTATGLLSLFPKSSTVLNLLATSNSALQRYDLAIETFRRALKVDPENAHVYNNMGNAFSRKGDLSSAIKCYEKGIEIDPTALNIYATLGVALAENGNFDAALKYLSKSLTIDPQNADTHCAVGSTLVRKGAFDQAIQSFKKALEIDPSKREAFNNMGVALRGKGALKAAIGCYDKAIAIDPHNVSAHYNKALLLLNLLDFEAGWPLYEYRWQKSKLDSVPVVTQKPKWRPGDQNRVLVWGEQGAGDEIMFASLIPDLYAACSQLIVKADRRLIPLFKRSFPADIEYFSNAETVSEDAYDTHISAGSLPKYFRRTLASYAKAAQGYLSADTGRAAALRKKLLDDGSKVLIGLSWHSISKIRVAQKRTIALGQLAAAFDAAKVKFVSLQYGNVQADIDRAKNEYGIDVVQAPEIDNFHDIDGLAALIHACDRVISIDNVTVHLAGALGKDIDVLLPRVSNWRWGLDPNGSYWYRSVRLHRQTEREEWDEVLARFS